MLRWPLGRTDETIRLSQRLSVNTKYILHLSKTLANSNLSVRIWRERGSRMMAEGRAAKLFHVSGTVQGVGFRFFAQRVARRLGLGGYVKNLRDGRVEVYAIGSSAQLGRLLPELERGPLGASVSEVLDEDAAVEEKYLTDFYIERDSQSKGSLNE